MGTDQEFLFSETRFSSDRTVVFEDNDEGYGSTKITFRAMYKDDVCNIPTVDVEDVVVLDTNDSISRIIDNCFGRSRTEPLSPTCMKSCRLDVETNSDLCTASSKIRNPVDPCWRSHKIKVVSETDSRTDGRTDVVKESSSTKATSGGGDFGARRCGADVPWKERKTNIDNALSWLRNELEGMRAQDKLLMSQLQRCRETIDSLKQQRSSWEEGSEYGDLDEEEEEDHWEDWEIAEYEKKYAENPEYSLDSDDIRQQLRRDSSETSSSRNSRDCLENHSSRNSVDGRDSVTETGHTGTQGTDRMSRCNESMESSESSMGSVSERRIKRQYSESSSSGSTKGLYFRQDIEVTV